MEVPDTGAKVDDGRRVRTAQTRAKLLACCRHMMAKGNLWPRSADIAEAAECSLRTVFERFNTLAMLYAEAVDDPDTASAVLRHALGEDWRVEGIPQPLVMRIAHVLVAGPGNGGQEEPKSKGRMARLRRTSEIEGGR